MFNSIDCKYTMKVLLLKVKLKLLLKIMVLLPL